MTYMTYIYIYHIYIHTYIHIRTYVHRAPISRRTPSEATEPRIPPRFRGGLAPRLDASGELLGTGLKGRRGTAAGGTTNFASVETSDGKP